MSATGYTATVEADEIVIRIPLAGVKYDELSPSASGKSRGIASSHGNVELAGAASIIGAPEKVMIGLNVYASVPKKDRVSK